MNTLLPETLKVKENKVVVIFILSNNSRVMAFLRLIIFHHLAYKYETSYIFQGKVPNGVKT